MTTPTPILWFNDPLRAVKEKYQLKLYKKLLEPTNPYSYYNNMDRMLNLVYRYYTLDGLNNRIKNAEVAHLAPRLNYLYEAQTNMVSQYFWATTAILGVGYNINRPQLVARDPSDRVIAGLQLARSIVNAIDETSLMFANDLRWSYKRFGNPRYTSGFKPAERPPIAFHVASNRAHDVGQGIMMENVRPPLISPLLRVPPPPPRLAGPSDTLYTSSVLPATYVEGLSPGLPPAAAANFGRQRSPGISPGVIAPLVGQPVNLASLQAPPAPPSPAGNGGASSNVGGASDVGAQSNVAFDPEKASQRSNIKNYRDWHGTFGSAVFSLNAFLAVGVQIGLIVRAATKEDKDRSGAEIASAALGLAGASANIFANGFKSLDTFGKTLVSKPAIPGPVADPYKDQRVEGLPGKAKRWKPTTSKGFGLAGTYAGGLINGLAGIYALTPYFFDDRLTTEQKGVIGAEFSAQVTASALQMGANRWLAQTVSSASAYAKSGEVLTEVAESAVEDGYLLEAARSVRLARLAGPGALAVLGALMAVTSPLEIYALIKQGEYADELDKLDSHGYAGNSLLADFYRGKNKVQGGIFAANTTLQIVSSIAVLACMITGGIGAAVAVPVGLAMALVGSVFT
ncbi:hypothetical protein [Polaromonas sp. YR568]|uniref:hypothetical protein n=1 Tax=Polaromonas sp. YR568 TaxID=1855301 RepID=UPI00398BF13A